MVRVASTVLQIVADDVGASHRVVAHDVLHLTLCPVCKGEVAGLLGVHERLELECSVITRGAVIVQHTEAGRGLFQPCAVGLRQILDLLRGDLGVPHLVIRAELLVCGDGRGETRGSLGVLRGHARPELQIPAEDVPVAGDVGDRRELCEYAAPDGIPAVYPDILPAVAGVLDDALHVAGVGVCAHVAGDSLIHMDDVVDVVPVLGTLIEPYRRPCQLVVVIAGGVEAAVIAQ